MSCSLVSRTTLLCRKSFSRPALYNTARFSSQLKDIQHLETEPFHSVEVISGAPGKKKKNAVTVEWMIKLLQRICWNVTYAFSNLLVQPLSKERMAPDFGVSILTLWKKAIVGKTLWWAGLLGWQMEMISNEFLFCWFDYYIVLITNKHWQWNLTPKKMPFDSPKSKVEKILVELKNY